MIDGHRLSASQSIQAAMIHDCSTVVQRNVCIHRQYLSRCPLLISGDFIILPNSEQEEVCASAF